MPGLVSNQVFELMRLSKEVNFMAVKYFYCNLTDSKNASGRLSVSLAPHDLRREYLWSYVYGQEITITKEDLCSIIGASVDGLNHMNSFDGAYSYRQVFDVTSVQGEVYKRKEALRATRLPLINRVLHLYLCYNYLPRTG